MVKIGASILDADFTHLKRDIRMLEQAGVDSVHLDVMDGHFVPNISFGPSIANTIKQLTSLFCDVHLMISSPKDYAGKFNADQVTFHIEACKEAQAWEIIDSVKKQARVGISLNPETDTGRILPLLDSVNTVLVMSVHPGFGGQSFIPATLEKIRKLRQIIDRKGLKTEISVDGGVNDVTAPRAIEAGADHLVIGSFLFKAPDPKAFIKNLKESEWQR